MPTVSFMEILTLFGHVAIAHSVVSRMMSSAQGSEPASGVPCLRQSPEVERRHQRTESKQTTKQQQRFPRGRATSPTHGGEGSWRSDPPPPPIENVEMGTR
eukprot:gene12433-biopygen6446